MKFIASIILTALVAFTFGIYLPWWTCAVAAFIVAFVIRQIPWKAWLAGFLGLFLLWALLAWWIDWRNQGILSKKIASLLPLGGSSLLLILVTAIVGGLLAGFAALTASLAMKRQ